MKIIDLEMSGCGSTNGKSENLIFTLIARQTRTFAIHDVTSFLKISTLSHGDSRTEDIITCDRGLIEISGIAIFADSWIQYHVDFDLANYLLSFPTLSVSLELFFSIKFLIPAVGTSILSNSWSPMDSRPKSCKRCLRRHKGSIGLIKVSGITISAPSISSPRSGFSAMGMPMEL